MARASIWRDRGLVALVVLFFATISVVGLTPYAYGLADQAVTIPFLKAAANASLYPCDFLLAERPYYYTFLWQGLGLLAKQGSLDIPSLIFASYFVALYLLFLSVFLIAEALFGQREVSFLSLFFLLFPKMVAGVLPFDGIFNTRIAVLPFLLFAIYLLLRGKYLLSWLLLGIGFLIHPMTTPYVIAMALVSCLVLWQRIGTVRLLWGLLIFALTASPIVIWKLMYSPTSLGLFYADPQWVALLRQRAEHHVFLASWGSDLFLPVGVLLVVFLATWEHRPGHDGHRVIVAATGAILAMGVLGYVFVEWLPVSIVINLQLLRSFLFFHIFVMIYLANYFFAKLQEGQTLPEKLWGALAAIALLYEAWHWERAYLALIALAGLMVLFQAKGGRRLLLSSYFFVALVGIVLILGGEAYLRRGGPWVRLEDAQEKEWLEVQVWAKEHTSLSDGFIVPPSTEGFRIEAERTIYGDWKDGTVMNQDPAFGFEWLRRMQRLGYREGANLEESYKSLTEADLRRVAKEMTTGSCRVGRVFAVQFRQGKALSLPVAYQNSAFTVYEVKD